MLRLFAILICLTLSTSVTRGDDFTSAHRIHGTVTTRDGEVVTGFIRQDRDDACWDHLFQARLLASPWAGMVDEDALAAERRAAYFESHGLLDRIAYVLEGEDREGSLGNQFICRYRDLRRLQLDREGDMLAVVNDGSEHVLRAGSRDLGGDLVLGNGETVDWDDVRSIEFFDAPSGTAPGPARLWGELDTADGSWSGWISWDRTECLADDVLDGDEDGGRDHEIPMGDIASIERVNSRSCRVILADGTDLVLSGSNDVNEDNRGIVVETMEFGRAVADWKTFRRLDFKAPPAEASPVRVTVGETELRGTVTTVDGARHSGRIVLDLDEGWTWEILDGHDGGIEYEIVLAGIAGIAKAADGVCTVEIRDGPNLTMGTGQDVGEENRGVLVLDGNRVVQVAWSQVSAIRFEP